MNEELIEQENKLYESTKDFGRIQFIREIIKLQQENAQLKIEKEQAIKSISHYVYERDVLQQQLKDKDELLDKIKKMSEEYCSSKFIIQTYRLLHTDEERKLLESNKED